MAELIVWMFVGIAVFIVPPILASAGAMNGLADGGDPGCLLTLWGFGGFLYLISVLSRIIEAVLL